MFLIDAPFESACDVLALLVEWAVNCPVSIPAAFRLYFLFSMSKSLDGLFWKAS